MMGCSQKAASALRLLGHAARKGSLLGGGKGLPAGKVGDLHNPNRMAAGQIGNLFPGQTPVANPKFNSNEIARLYAAIMKGRR